jgi:hypothetical protein
VSGNRHCPGRTHSGAHTSAFFRLMLSALALLFPYGRETRTATPHGGHRCLSGHPAT